MSKTQEKPRILLIGNFLSVATGTRGVCEDLSDRLTDLGYSVLFASEKKNRLLRLIDMLSTIIFNANNYDMANVDVFSGRSFLWAELCAGCLRLFQKPFVLTLHGGNLGNYFHQHPKRVEWLIRMGSKVITPSRYLQSCFIVVRPDIQWLPNALELKNYQYLSRAKAQGPLVWLRAFHEIYSPDSMADVLHALHKDHPTLSLIMVGPDKQDGSKEKFLNKIANYRLEDFVEITGAVPKSQVPDFLNKGDIFVNTTKIESFGVSVLEAGACGLPIVTSDAGELPFFWEDGEDALIVPVGDVDGFVTAIRRILEEPGLAAKLSANARKKAEQFDWFVVLPKWEHLFAEVANES